MDQRVGQLLEEIIRITEQLRRETEESRGYYQRGDSASILRNTNDNRDEVRDLLDRWEQLTQLLNNQ